MENIHDTFAEKVEVRLDEIFGDTEPTPEVIEESTDQGYYPLRFLKATVLSIDWEITDDVLVRFIEQVDKLKENHKDDKILVPMFQMLNYMGKHIRNNRENSHPDSLKILKSIYVAIEKVITTKDMSEMDKKKILSKEIKKFNVIRPSIASRSKKRPQKKLLRKAKPKLTRAPKANIAAKAEKVMLKEVSNLSISPDQVVTKDFLIMALKEVKQHVSKEIRRLREDFSS